MTAAGPRPGEALLPPGAAEALTRVLEELRAERASVSSVTDPERAWRVHVADSLSGLEVDALREARRIADIGAGAGFPGIVLAAALPAARVDLIESVGRKCEFMRRAAAAAGLANASVLCTRSEELASGAGREAYAAATARAVGRLSTLAELASPLLAEGGVLVAWKGRRDPGEEEELGRAAAGAGDATRDDPPRRAPTPAAGTGTCTCSARPVPPRRNCRAGLERRKKHPYGRAPGAAGPVPPRPRSGP